jgi:hypothetical protein
MLTIKIIPKSILLLSMALLTSAVTASEHPIHIGVASLVVNDVFTTTSTGESRIKLNDELFFKQQVLTKEDSTLTVTFRDDSTFSVSPQSVVVLDEFVFNPSENILDKTINILKGSFRYISGFPIKGASIKIITPFGTAGIRGSAVQGVISPVVGLTINVGSGEVVFTTKDGKTSTIHEGETLAISALCDTLPTVPLSTVANTMQTIENTFPNTSASTSQQILENAKVNNLPVAEQKRAYTMAPATSIAAMPKSVPKVDMLSMKLTDAEAQELIDKLILALKNKNNAQVDQAIRHIITASVVSKLSSDKITQIATNAVLGAKNSHKLQVAATIIVSLQALKSDLVQDIAHKVQQALPVDQQSELPSLVPNVTW